MKALQLLTMLFADNIKIKRVCCSILQHTLLHDNILFRKQAISKVSQSF